MLKYVLLLDPFSLRIIKSTGNKIQNVHSCEVKWERAFRSMKITMLERITHYLVKVNCDTLFFQRLYRTDSRIIFKWIIHSEVYTV